MKGEETPGNLAFLPWFPADFRRDTQLLSREAKLLYRELLDLYWEQKGVIPWDASANGNRIALALGCPQDEWERAWPEVKPYFDIIDGHLRNKRADCELAAAREKQKTLKKAGLAGAKARWKDHNDAKRNADGNADDNAVANADVISKRHAVAMPPIPNPISKKEESSYELSCPKSPKGDSERKRKRAPAARHDQRFDEWYEAYPKSVDKKPAREVWKRKRLDARADELIADVKRRAAEHAPWQDEQFIRSPARYLRDESWQDEITPITTAMTNRNGTTHDQPKGAITTYAERAFAEAERRDAAQAAHAEHRSGDGPEPLEGARPGLRAVSR